MNRIEYFFKSVKNIKTKGTIAPTSRFTCREIMKHIDFSQASCIVELGAGDGSITKHLLSKLRPDAKLISFEIDANFCQILNEIDDPRLTVVEDSAEFIGRYLEEHDIPHADYVVSGLPFVVLPNELGYKILRESKEVLKPGGSFIQFHYSTLFKKHYERIFDSIDIKLEVRNIPPAFVFVCQ